mmetsp:Transcript_21255/g.37631  ORF Transcript_21255/g.37631 Transcript_21255/m.37631 type:complete len:292 (+) Transcript_21255:172-1047(+)|eukprot:CAMPEP_0184510514 /NCGR_PEP_ID=MMETSP0198_2-20121128/1856_1 /TAXON_ID=1112570 /ORGANISM="Thraustochytrium sp., Strain LLF1b" /LENGTH=291 /DNA_ID=CAMNT_0026900413 /DNA_START=793 /DNA_END=1668 /DNA_ORIENTATION=+
MSGVLDADSLRVLASGSFAGACSTAAGAPFDTLKTRCQVDSRGLWNTVREESLLTLYRGVSPALTSAVVENSVVFAANGVLKRQVTEWRAARDRDTLLSLPDLAVIGGVSGVFSATAVCPAEVVKVRMQAQKTYGRSSTKFNGALDCLMKTFQEGGIRGLFRGLPAQVARDVPFNFVFFGAYETFCVGLCMLRQVSHKDDLGSLDIVFAGGMAGITGWTVSLPMDVIKSRMQNECMRNKPAPLTNAVRDLWRTHGLRGFFRGWGAVALRAFPCNGALFIGYEACNSYLAGP